MAGKLLKIGFIGGGKMAQAMAKGFISAGLAKGETLVSSCHPSDAQSVAAFQDMGAESHFDNLPVLHKSDVIFIAVKPNIVPAVLKEIKEAEGARTEKLFLSIAMGVPIRALEQGLPKDTRVIRVMPNTPALVRSAASVFVTGSSATERDAEIAKKLLKAIGTVEQVNEYLIDAITGLSGSGPAYIYVLIEALADGGVKMGLPRDLSYRLASQTVLGSAQMVRDTRVHPGVLKDEVTSPGGSTAAGLGVLEDRGFRAALIGAVESATNRCRQVASETK